ncbi:hypothetical protein AW736_09605 [Termitidicoccus mucosus]|uniref:HTH lacI-type domain-containing protein n=2 Tax=Termitidicoccus mucosus TaxID=1184151 RepID=A0A178ILN1_9BACT|nr:hypothetical protein AW736_09605 [Opitutaceae bacterium TSB47]
MPAPNSNRRVTMRDIAKVAGCHYTTVSLALRNHPGLPKKTCERLRALADKMGYVPDPMLASLTSYRTSLRPASFRAVIGWITNHPTRNGWRNVKIFEDYFLGAEKRAQSLGYQLKEFWLRESDMTTERVSQILRSRGINGLIVAPQPEATMAVDIDWSLFSAVAIGYSLTRPHLHLVCPNQYRGIRMAMSEIAARGYQRPGFVMARTSDERVENNWSAGFLTSQHMLRDEDRVPPLLLDAWDNTRFKEWLAQHRPDVLITKYEEVPVALQRMKYAVPRDIGVVFLTLVEPGGKRSGIYENPGKVGAGALELVTSLMRQGERGIPDAPQQLLIETSWIEGQMVRKARGASKAERTRAGK